MTDRSKRTAAQRAPGGEPQSIQAGHPRGLWADLAGPDLSLLALIENMPVLVTGIDAEGVVRLWNRECERVTGYSAREMVGNRAAFAFLCPDAARRTSLLRELSDCRFAIAAGEWMITCKAGHGRTIAWSYIPAAKETPALHAWGVGVNVTDARRAEERLLRAQRGLESCVRERTNELTAANESLRQQIRERAAVESLLRLDRDLLAALSAVDTVNALGEVVMRSAMQIPTIDCGGLYMLNEGAEAFELAVARNLSDKFIERVRFKPLSSSEARLVQNGRLVYQSPAGRSDDSGGLFKKEGIRSLVVIPILHEDRVLACLNAASKVADHIPGRVLNSLEALGVMIGGALARVQLSERLRISEASLRALLDAIPAAASLVDRGENVLACNEEEARNLNAPRARIVGHHVSANLDPDIVGERLRRLRRVFQTGKLEHFTDERAGRFLEHRLTPVLGDDGRVTRVAILGLDLTDRRRVEAEERALQAKLEHASRLSLLGEMATQFAHELNQPLSAILSFARGCERRLEAGNPNVEELAGCIREIAKQANRSAEVIRRIRRFATKREMRVRAVDMTALVEEAERLIAHAIAAQGAQVEVVASTTMTPVRADELLMQQVVVNLMQNALDAVGATNGPGRITIRIAADSGSRAVVYVSDNGPGIPESQRDRLFEPFFTTKPDGTGLGLSISRTIVSAHGGELWLDSADGGVTFAFSIPLAGARDAASHFYQSRE